MLIPDPGSFRQSQQPLNSHFSGEERLKGPLRPFTLGLLKEGSLEVSAVASSAHSTPHPILTPAVEARPLPGVQTF